MLAALAAASALPASSAYGQANSPQAVIQSALGEGQPFSAAAVIEVARMLSRRPYAAPPIDLPEPYAGLNYERYIAIKAKPAGRIWDGEGRGFVAEPLPRGFVFTTPVTIFTVEDGQVRRTVFDRSRFDFGDLNLPASAPDPGFSGVRLTAAPAGAAPFEFAILQGATFFRASARGQNFGIVARALTLKPAETRGEEFPAFRALWLERPVPGTNVVVLHGLMDSESASGAVRMTFRPGEATIVDVETTLFPRLALEHVGLGGMVATFLFGPNVRRGTDDVRPAVYEAAGLSMLNGKGEWLWRPLNNPDTLQISAFLDDSPRGFGLVQRERDFASFQDDAQHYERRPSLWIEPLGEWAQGAVQLIEIPSEAEINKNIMAYWRPRAAMAAGSEVSFAYRQFWSWTPPERPQLATVAATRSGRGGAGRRRRFLVDFSGPLLAEPPSDLAATVTASPGSIQNTRVWIYPERRSVRVSFDLDPGNEAASEMRLVLMSGTKSVSETWLYRWTP